MRTARRRGESRRLGQHEPSGIEDLRGSLAGRTAVFCCAGTTMQAAYLAASPFPPAWPVFAINGAMRMVGAQAAYWVLADIPIVHEYARSCPEHTTILAMHEAGPEVLQALPRHEIRTVHSTPDLADAGDGYRFFSRGTVLIGALLMARYMGIATGYVFGLDCYRTAAAYYYDGRKPTVRSESDPRVRDCTPCQGGVITPRLMRMIERLREARSAGLFCGMDLRCVGSPLSAQDAIERMTVDEFRAVARRT